MRVFRQIIEIDEDKCTGCGLCVPACEEGAIQIINGKAKVVAEKYCDGLGACLGHCPEGAIKVVEREAEEFDPEAVEEYLKSRKKVSCVSCEDANTPKIQKLEQSMLGQWPVQIKLVPPHAQFLQNSDLLILADCAAVAYPNLHEDFLKDKVVMMGCPKFDDKEEYVNRFAEIFSINDINSITVLMMEVPCCSGLRGIIEKAMLEANKEIKTDYKILSIKGKLKS
jgi:ferredoxin